MLRRAVFFVFAFSTLSLLMTSCDKDDDNPTASSSFKVTITNAFSAKTHFSTGVFNTPVGASEAGPLFPDQSYQFEVNAAPNHSLFFATMYVQSNDLFLSNDPQGGFPLYDSDSNPINSATYTVDLWDAGTEVNQALGVGDQQAPRQSGANVGTTENGTVQLIDNVNDGFMYPSGPQIADIRIEYESGTRFTVTIVNTSSSSSLPSPLAPGNWVVTNATDNPFFVEGQSASAGLEAMAEDGNPAVLDGELTPITGYDSPYAPGVWAIHDGNVNALFTDGQADAGEGLEALAEDGSPGDLGTALEGKSGVASSGVFNTPTGASAPGPLLFGESYEFTFEAEEGDYLSLATMLVQTNDLFYAFDENGIALFENGSPISGDVTAELLLWDAGTEVNEYPGTGANQAPRQSAANTGSAENGTVQVVNDTFNYPDAVDAILISISPIGG